MRGAGKPAARLRWGPLALLLLGLFGLIRYLKKRARRVASEEQPLSDEDARRAEALLKELDSK